MLRTLGAREIGAPMWRLAHQQTIDFRQPRTGFRHIIIETPDETSIHTSCTGVEGMVNLTAIKELRRASQFLYGSQIPHTLYAGARCLDRHLVRRFDHYVAETSVRLPEINRLLVGEAPHWRADFPCPEHARHLQGLSLDELRGHLPLPASLFA